MKKKPISAKTFDRRFDQGKSVSPYLRWKAGKLVKPRIQRVNVDFPDWMVRALDQEAARIGVTRQSVIKMWLAEKLEGSES